MQKGKKLEEEGYLRIEFLKEYPYSGLPRA